MTAQSARTRSGRQRRRGATPSRPRTARKATAAPAAAHSGRSSCPETADGTRDTESPRARRRRALRRSRNEEHHGAEHGQPARDHRAEGERIPGIDQRPHQRESRPAAAPGLRYSISPPAKSSPGLHAERRQIGVHAAAGDDERHRPQRTADGERDGAAEERRREAAADAVEQHPGEQRQRQHRVLRAESNGEACEERAEHDHPARRGRLLGGQAAIAVGAAAAAATTRARAPPARPAPPPARARRSSAGPRGTRTTDTPPRAPWPPARRRRAGATAHRGSAARRLPFLPATRPTSSSAPDSRAGSRQPRR